MRPYLVACGLLCVALLVLAGLRWSAASVAEPAAPISPAGSAPAQAQLPPTRGPSACTGPACHGQGQGRSGGKVRRDEYQLWNLWDPHAHAYHALEGQHAQEIIANLVNSGEFQEATREPRCLVCHTDPYLAADPAREGLRVNGVGCESCHGAAGPWLNLHHAEKPPPKEELEKLGMRNLGEPTILAGVCAGCHVGSSAQDGQPARELTHDLLAAGHPRLHFELTVYLANLPPHWNAQEKARTRGQDFEARAWAAGQVVAARASLQLLAYQAQRGAPWPEFAAHDCEACHTPLHPRTKSLGTTLPMSRWSFSLLDEVGAQLSKSAPGAADVSMHLKELKNLLEKPQQKSGQVARKAALVEAELAGWGKPLEQWKCDPASLMKKIARQAPADQWNWEEATQRYLALSALEQARQASSNDDQHQRIQNELLGLADKLAFPPSYSGPRDYSAERLLTHFRKIQEQLGE